MKGKISKMHLFYEGEVGFEVIERYDTKWLFIAFSEDGWKKISLSGNDRDDAYLLRILENSVMQTINETNKYGGGT